MTDFPDSRTRALTRRAFLRSGFLAAGGLWLASCSKGAASKPVSVFPGGLEILSGTPQRFTFGLVDSAGKDVIESVELNLVSENGERLTSGSSRWMTYSSTMGPQDPIGFHVARLLPMTPGFWDVEVSTSGKAHGIQGKTTIEVLSAPNSPAVGSRPPMVTTPTKAEPRGYEQICTRKPACDLHETSLDDAIGRESVLLVVGSPLLCQSRTCGPVLDEVLSLRSKANVRFIHVEPYTELNTISLAPIMQEWRLPSEPWVFLLDRNGRVAKSFEGPVVASEILSALTKS